jgi:hypothetical protein
MTDTTTIRAIYSLCRESDVVYVVPCDKLQGNDARETPVMHELHAACLYSIPGTIAALVRSCGFVKEKRHVRLACPPSTDGQKREVLPFYVCWYEL